MGFLAVKKSSVMLAHLLHDGWKPMNTGVFRFPAVPPPFHAECRAYVLKIAF